MKKIAIRIATLLCLCLAFSLTIAKADVKAADGEDITSNVDKFAYIYKDNSFVLRFVPFSDSGYTYEVFKGEGEEKVAEGTLAAAKNLLQLDPGVYGGYTPDTVYTVKLIDTKSGDFVSVKYRGGDKLASQKAVNDNTRVDVKWTLAGEQANDYDSFQITLCDKGAPKNQITKTVAGSATSASLDASSYESGKYASVVAGMKDGCYGYGWYYTLVYTPTPDRVAALSATVDTGKITLSWSTAKNATGYSIYYKKGTGSYSLLKKTKGTTYKLTGLAGGTKYSFKILSYNYVPGKKSVSAASYSPVKSVTVPKVAGKVQGAKFSLDDYGYLFLSWKKTAKATAYEVYRKAEGDSSYKLILKTKKTKMKVKGLKDDTKYTFLIYACSGKYRSAEHATKKIKPADYYKAHIRFLASRVKTIKYVGYSRCIYTKKKYSKAVREAYVNYKGYASRSKYLIFASLYTQQATIFKGSKGKWKAWKTFLIASGAADGRTPRGTFTLKYKERKWQHKGWHSSYVSHFYKKASFHARPTYNSGKIKEKTLGKPISNACIRCPTPIAKFIYSSIPVGTKVRVR